MTEAEDILSCALDVGADMLTCGAEIGRVEDTIGRILRAYGALRYDVFTITSSIVVTLHMGEGPVLTQTRRIFDQRIDLNRLDELNALSRRICRDTPGCAGIHESLTRIAHGPRYSRRTQFVVYAMSAAAFSMFFGGSWRDALASAAIGLFLKWLIDALSGLSLNKVLANAIYAFAGGAVAVLAVRLSLAQSFDKVAIGDIMLLIPGVALTNALRDMMSDDTISGMTRLIQAVLIAIAVATGFALAGGLLT